MAGSAEIGVAPGLAVESSGRIGDIGEDIRSTVVDLQAILGGRDPDRDIGLDVALRTQLEAVARAQGSLHGIEISFEATGTTPLLPARLSWDLQCVLEEAITNAVKHGNASEVVVTLASEERCIRVQVVDNGVGLGASEQGERASTGLSGMRARLEFWGGEISVADRSGGVSGTCFTAQVPFSGSVGG